MLKILKQKTDIGVAIIIGITTALCVFFTLAILFTHEEWSLISKIMTFVIEVIVFIIFSTISILIYYNIRGKRKNAKLK